MIRGGICAAVLAVVMPVAAMAGQCGYEYCWGAVGVGPSGEWGFAHSYISEDSAIERVNDECPGCTAIETFYNACGAIALGQNGNYGFGWGESRAIAEDQAMGYCWENSSTCNIEVWACSP